MINTLELKEFTNFQDNTFEFAKGVNVFIGKNGCGKTHILKVLCSSINALDEMQASISKSKDTCERIMADNLREYFMPDALHRIVRRGQGVNTSIVKIRLDKEEIHYRFSSKSITNVNLVRNSINKKIDYLYIPPVEILSHFKGFLGLIEEREVAYDKAYINFAKALQPPLTKGSRFDLATTMVDIFKRDLSIEVIKRNDRFYVKDSSGEIEAHLVAEGLRKIATIMYLTLNGALHKDSILFWDEPESHLNPALIKVIADFIILLSKDFGIQSFISTHDYLLTNLLSLKSEYGEIDNIKFFCLDKNSEGVTVFEGSNLSMVENNPILEEYAGLYDIESRFIAERLSR